MSNQDSVPPERNTETPTLHEFVDFLVSACRILMECGCSSNRVELLTTRLGLSWGFEVETMAIPTGVWLAVRRGKERVLELTRIKNWGVDLDKLVRLNDLVDLIEVHQISIPEAHIRMQNIAKAPAPYPWYLTLLAGGGSSLGLVYFFGGDSIELFLAFVVGLLVQAINKYGLRTEAQRHLSDFICAMVVAAVVLMFKRVFPGIDAPKLTVGGLTGLFPGLTFVNAVHEIAQKNLVSGTAKLIEGLVVSMTLVFGVLFIFGVYAAIFHR